MNHDIDHTRHDIGDDMFPTGIEGLDEATAPATLELADGTVLDLRITPVTDGHRAFVALVRGNHVADVDAKTLAIRGYIPTGARTWGIAAGLLQPLFAGGQIRARTGRH